MADFYEDYGLEVEPDNYGADPDLMPKKETVVKGGGVVGRIVALLLGVVIGVGGTVGGVVGAGYYVATQPVENTLNAVNNFTGANIDFSKYISSDYAKLTVMGLVGEITNVAGKFASGEGCLNDLADISPYVSTAIEPLLETIEGYGLELDKDTVMSKPVSELPSYLMDEAKKIKLVDILNTANMAQTPIIEAICYDQDGNAVTVGDVMDGGPESLLSNIPLKTLLIHESGVVDPEADTLILALSYGNANRYTVGSEDSKVYMNQMTFTVTDGKLCDIDGNEVEATLENGVYKTATVDGEIVYLKATNTEATEFAAYEDAEYRDAANYKKVMVGDLMGGEATDLFNDLELGSLFNVSPLKEDSDPITLALAYGEEGTHYEIKDGKIVWLEDENGELYGPRTIGTLLSGDLTTIMNDMQLGTVLGISPLDNYDNDDTNDADPLMLALAYGEKGTHYEIASENGEYVIEWKDDNQPRTIGYLTENADTIFNEIQLSTVLGISPLDNYDNDENNDADSLMLALAYGYEGTDYELKDTDGDGAKDSIEWLGDSKPQTIQALTDGNAFNDLRLAAVLDADIYADPNDPDVDAMTHAIAFGYQGTHYELEDTDNDGDLDVVWKEKPADTVEDGESKYYDYRTVGDMSNMNDILDELRIETALSVTHESPRLLHVLAYGSEGTDFAYEKQTNEEGEEEIVGFAYINNYNTIADLSSSEEDGLINSLKLKDILGEEAVKDDLLLKHLGEETLETLPDAIGNLTFKQVYPEQIYITKYLNAEGQEVFYDKENDLFYKTIETNGKSETYYYNPSEVTVQYQVEYIKNYNGTEEIAPNAWPDKIMVVDGIGWVNGSDLEYHDDGYYHLKAETETEQYQVHLKLTSQWKYLLQASTDEDGESHDYKMTEFAELVKNMTDNMQKATLYQLSADEIIDLGEETLETPLLTEIKIQTGTVNGNPVYTTIGRIEFTEAIQTEHTDGPVLGDLTITQILNYTSAVLQALNNLSL